MCLHIEKVVWGERRFKSPKEQELREFSKHHSHSKVYRTETYYK